MTGTRDVFLATKNAGKRAEFADLFEGTGLRPVAFDGYNDPVEGDASYRDNAALKADALRSQMLAAGIAADVLADDSGLEIAALDGRPGVITADYGGASLTWAERRRFVLDELAALGVRDRSARFVCYLHFIAADGVVVTAFGDVEGRIALEERGIARISFDSIFEYGPAGRTFAELDALEKNAVSHRARAVAQLLQRLTDGADGR